VPHDTGLIAAIYDCLIEPSRWEEVIKRIACRTRSLGGGLLTHRADGTAHVTAKCNIDPFYADAYVQNYHKISPLVAAAWRIPPGEVKSHAYITRRDDYKNSSFYNEWARPQGWVDIVAIGILKTPAAVLQLRLPRSTDASSMTPAEWHFIQTLAPHLRRQAQLQQLLSRQREATSSLGAAIAAAGFAAFLLGGDRRILFANTKAEDLLRHGAGLRCERGQLAAATPFLTNRLGALARQAVRSKHGEGETAGTIELPRGSGGAPLFAHVIPLGADRMVSNFDFDRPAAAVFVVDPASNFGGQIKRFAGRFGLTAAETRVLGEIVRGNGLPAAATVLKIGKATAHTHAIRIFAKTGTAGQAELVRRFFEASLPYLPARTFH